MHSSFSAKGSLSIVTKLDQRKGISAQRLDRKGLGRGAPAPRPGPLPYPAPGRGLRQLVWGRFAQRVLKWVQLGMPGSRSQASAGDFGPGFEGLGPGGSVVGDRAVVSTKVEEVGDRIVDR